jgi:hypothetical protein
MLEEAGRYAEVLALAIGAVGVGIMLYSFAAKKNILVTGLGSVVAAAAFVAPMLLRAPPVNVIVFFEKAGKVETIERKGFYGGDYIRADGSRLAIGTDRTWGRMATVVVNDTNRLLRLHRYLYSKIKFAGGQAIFSGYVLPHRIKLFHVPMSLLGSEDDKPPATIRAPEGFDSLLLLTYTREPYDPDKHGDGPRLQAARESRGGMVLKEFPAR